MKQMPLLPLQPLSVGAATAAVPSTKSTDPAASTGAHRPSQLPPLPDIGSRVPVRTPWFGMGVFPVRTGAYEVLVQDEDGVGHVERAAWLGGRMGMWTIEAYNAIYWRGQMFEGDM